MRRFFAGKIIAQGFVMVEPRSVSDLNWGPVSVGQRLASDPTPGSALVGGQIGICLLWLYGSPTVVVWSKGMCAGRAKTAKGSGEVPRKTVQRVCCSRETAAGSAGILGSRAKVRAGCVMLVRSRQIAYRYVVIGMGWSVDHCGPLPRLYSRPLICPHLRCQTCGRLLAYYRVRVAARPRSS